MKYKTIVIDPPWKVDFIKLKRRPNQIKMPYKTMSKKELEEFKINDFADESCDLFVWTTHTWLPYTFELIKKWGFKYHCLLVWDKGNGLSLFGFTRKTEFIVYCYKGKIGVNQKGKFIPTLFNSKQTKHSEKPRAFYQLIRYNTQKPRIDVFARERHDGFDSWGNEVKLGLQKVLMGEFGI